MNEYVLQKSAALSFAESGSSFRKFDETAASWKLYEEQLKSTGWNPGWSEIKGSI